MQLINLALKGTGHHPLAQTFDAVHLGFHQASAVVANPAFPDTAAQTPTRSKRCVAVLEHSAFAHSRILTGRNDGDSAVLFAFPLAFTQELDTCRINQKAQACLTAGVRNLDIQISLPPAQGAEVWNGPGKATQLQHRLHQASSLSQRQAKQVLERQTKLNCCIRELRAAPAFAQTTSCAYPASHVL